MVADEEKRLRTLYIHEHLLSALSALLEVYIKMVKNERLNWIRTSLDLTAASRYLGFLYGNPMWAYAPGTDINREWLELNEIYHFCTDVEDFAAADVCIDGMREILQDWRGDLTRPFDHLQFFQSDLGNSAGRLVVDYMVHRSCDIKQWIDAYEECGWLEHPDSLQDTLSKKFAEEAQRMKDKISEPDLMDRCRYHLHVEKGLPCYLDK